MRLKGCIDRLEISWDESRLRVTDYKTGKMADYEDDALRGGTTVQLPLYMLAAEKLLAPGRPGLRAGEARYLSVDRAGDFQTVTFSAQALASRREDLSQILSTYVSGVARGVFFAYPETQMCSRCDYRLACGEGREARFARKRSDMTAADYLKMREVVK
ncbi:MAG TPA: PD-(D/E)XK nuclease family protein [Patescibacteria group bacterium]|nr:PD-(D/E)XK nuclease family protein [Patescibacteria group bacterium]